MHGRLIKIAPKESDCGPVRSPVSSPIASKKHKQAKPQKHQTKHQKTKTKTQPKKPKAKPGRYRTAIRSKMLIAMTTFVPSSTMAIQIKNKPNRRHETKRRPYKRVREATQQSTLRKPRIPQPGSQRSQSAAIEA